MLTTCLLARVQEADGLLLLLLPLFAVVLLRVLLLDEHHLSRSELSAVFLVRLNATSVVAIQSNILTVLLDLMQVVIVELTW